MNCILQHIQYLLRTHSCVIMPRLGALIATERGAAIDEQRGIIRAPMREICFNAAVINNDGLLATSIARKEQISYEAACSKMDNAIEAIKHQLFAEKEVQLGRIGILRLSSDGRIIFNPSRTAEQQSLALGLNSITFPKREDAGNSQIHNTKDNNYYYLRISKTALRAAASLALPIVAALSILLWTLSLDNNENTSANIDYASVLPVKKIKTTPHISENTTHEESSLGQIVVAVFGNRDQASLFIQRHSKSPYNLTIAKSGDNYRITTYGLQTREDLVKLLHKTDFIIEYPGSWILMQEPE